MVTRNRLVGIVVGAVLALSAVIWLFGSRNPETPAGYMGYLTRGAVFGKTKFYGLQKGPTSPGRGWLLDVINVSITPYTYNEDFFEKEAVLSKDNLQVEFRVHLVWRAHPERIKDFVEKYSVLYDDKNPDKVVKDAYKNFVQEPLRTYSRDEIQKHKALEIKDNITPIGQEISRRISALTKDTPFEVSSVVVGNIQYPADVASAVAKKLAETQKKEQAEIAIETERALAKKRVVEAEGIAKAMEIINAKLTNQYLQHEAIEAQKGMVNSPNHTTIYIPVGPMGVPLVGTFDASSGATKSAPKQKSE